MKAIVHQEGEHRNLVLAGRNVRVRDEFVSLTDMWRASGESRNKAPAEWLRTDQAREFREFLEESLITGAARDSLVESERGAAGGTFAHWQLGMAYAKYLSPAFHAECNTVVRDHMLGRRSTALAPAREDAIDRLCAVVGQSFAEMRQIVGTMSSDVRGIGARVENLEAKTDRVEKLVLEHIASRRRNLTARTKAQHIHVVARLGGRCPCCQLVEIVRDGQVVNGAEFDHFYTNQQPDPQHTWLICGACHRMLTHIEERTRAVPMFSTYQHHRGVHAERQLRLVG